MESRYSHLVVPACHGQACGILDRVFGKDHLQGMAQSVCRLDVRVFLKQYRSPLFLPAGPFVGGLLIKMQPTDLTVAGCGVCMMLPDTILPPGMGVLFFLGYTSVVFRFGRNFSRPTVYCFFKIGRLLPSLSSYCQPLPLRAAFMASTAVCQSPSVTCSVPPVPTWSSPMPCVWPLLPQKQAVMIPPPDMEPLKFLPATPPVVPVGPLTSPLAW